MPQPTLSRQATNRDLDQVTACIAMAFADDPVWGPALRPSDGSTAHLIPYWRLFVEGAHRYGTVRMTPDGGAVSVWLPPGKLDELSGAGAAAFERLLDDEGDAAWRADLDELYERFAASRHPLDDHYYLSLLATHHEHRGKGVGQALLAADLAMWDADGVPAYLESTNPSNDHRYERAGFRSIGGFQAVRGGGWVNAMWRDPR